MISRIRPRCKFYLSPGFPVLTVIALSFLVLILAVLFVLYPLRARLILLLLSNKTGRTACSWVAHVQKRRKHLHYKK